MNTPSAPIMTQAIMLTSKCTKPTISGPTCRRSRRFPSPIRQTRRRNRGERCAVGVEIAAKPEFGGAGVVIARHKPGRTAAHYDGDMRLLVGMSHAARFDG